MVEKSPLDFREIFDQIPSSLLVLDAQLRIIDVNQSYLTATMTRRRDILGRPLFEVFPDNPGDPAADGVRNLRASLSRVLKHRRMDHMAIQKYDIARPNNEGFEVRYWSPVNTPILDDHGEITCIVHQVQDVTAFMGLKNVEAPPEERRKMNAEVYLRQQELARLNEKLRHSEESLREANQELATFSYTVSHDLRAPLRALAGFGQILVDEHTETLNAQGRKYLDRIVSAAVRMGHLIDGLLSLAKVGQQHFRLEALNLSAMAEEIVSEIKDGGMAVQIDFQITPDLRAVGDPALVTLVLQNLIGNAVKFSSKNPGGRVEFGVAKESADTFYVRDNGVGFDPAFASSLFEPFQRLHAASDFEGSGIGLATVRKILRRHDGRIWAESQPGAGATFYFTLKNADKS